MSKGSNEPLDIRQIFDRPGQQWSETERKRVQEWLHETACLKKLLGFALFHLGPAAVAADAEDTWMNFCAKRLEQHILLYDPARGRRFWNFLLFCFQRYCWEEKEKLKKRAAQEARLEIQFETPAGEVIEWERADPSEESDLPHFIEKKALFDALYKCLDELPSPYQTVIRLYYFAEETLTKIAAMLQITLSNVKIRLYRARQKLEECLREQGVEGSLP